MRLSFNEDQLRVLNKIGFDFDVSGDLSDDEILEIDEKVSDYFATHGIEHDEVNAVGLICESIMDLLGEL